MGLAWLGWISVQVYQSHFFAEEVYQGSPNPQSSANTAYVEGMKAASMALVGNAILMALSTRVFDSARIALGERGLWLLATQTTAMMLAFSVVIPGLKSRAVAVAWLVLLGPAYAVQLTIPYVILANRAPNELQGELLGLLNVAVCIPQLMLSLVGGVITAWAGTDTVLFAAGAVSNAAAAAVCWQLLRRLYKEVSSPRVQSDEVHPRDRVLPIPPPVSWSPRHRFTRSSGK